MSLLFNIAMLFVGAELAKGLWTVIGGNLYDLRAAKQLRDMKQHPHTRRYRRRRFISVVVVTRNDASHIQACLDSVTSSDYRKFEVIVVDNASNDGTKRLVKAFIANHPKQKMHLVSKRKPLDSRAAFRLGSDKYATGELVLPLTAACQLDSSALKNLNRHFASPVYTVISNMQIIEDQNLVSNFQQLASIAASRLQKAGMTNQPSAMVGSVTLRSVFLQPETPSERSQSEGIQREKSINYAHDVLVYKLPLPRLRSLIARQFNHQLDRLKRLLSRSHSTSSLNLAATSALELTRLAEPVLFVYFLYLALRLNQPWLFGLSWLAVTAFLGFLVWTDEHLPRHQKLKLTLLLPLMFNLLGALSLVRLVALGYFLANQVGRVRRVGQPALSSPSRA